MNETTSREQPSDYLAFLLRLWREEGSPFWRAMLVDTRSGAEYAFANLQEMETFLHRQTDATLIVSTEHEIEK